MTLPKILRIDIKKDLSVSKNRYIRKINTSQNRINKAICAVDNLVHTVEVVGSRPIASTS